MSITIRTIDPEGLLQGIKDAINGIAKTNINTWEISSKGSFTHKSDQYGKKAYLKPIVGNKVLEFKIIKPNTGANVSDDVNCYYHGHFSYMILSHFRNEIIDIILD